MANPNITGDLDLLVLLVEGNEAAHADLAKAKLDWLESALRFGILKKW